jgi:frataxin-like iron-binding protein CyaY
LYPSLSSHSGPKRFDYSTEEGVWVCFKEGQRTVFHELLDQELSEVMGQQVHVLRDVLEGAE